MVVPDRLYLARLVKLGACVALLIPTNLARGCGLHAGTSVRLAVLDDEIRVRRVTSPRAQDFETDEERDKRVRLEARCHESEALEADDDLRAFWAAPR
jgi:antitoxin component of MazEF toxin-antitoxin module